jgi:hypothetical protein
MAGQQPTRPDRDINCGNIYLDQAFIAGSEAALNAPSNTTRNSALIFQGRVPRKP